MNHLAGIAEKFRIGTRVAAVSTAGSGHINDSYHVTTVTPEKGSFLLQRINHRVFTDVPALMQNIRLVTGHLRNKLQHSDDGTGFLTLELVETISGKVYFEDPYGNFWRLYNYIHGSLSHDRVADPEMACQGGQAYGRFQALTADLDASRLAEILPGFHDINLRLERFRQAVKNDVAERVPELTGELHFINQHAEEMQLIHRLGDAGSIPLRVTHNDTKFNNVLFNEQRQAICVVDLDTVMPGYAMFDFGDAIRTGANAAEEDEADLSKVDLRLDLFDAYARGYLEMAGGLLNKTEKEHLAFSAKFMTFIIGLRFLTDYIEGDHYFKTAFPGHNLQRARAQFKLLQSMESRYNMMCEIIRKYTL